MSTAETQSPTRSLLLFGGGGAALLLAWETLGSFGNQIGGDGFESPAATVAMRTLLGAFATFLWLAPMVQLAGFITRRCVKSSTEFPVRVAVGMGLGFTVTHLIAWLGAFSPQLRGITLTLWLIGAVFAIISIVRWVAEAWRKRELQTWFHGSSAAPFLALVPIALMFLAASQPPGWLWDSEFGGFDSLSYHLQLPQEWIAAGRLNPVDHNVYSYLPSYVESVFMQFGAAAETLNSLGAKSDQTGLLTFDGLPLLVCQHFHVWCAVIAAWLTGRVVLLLTEDRTASGIAFAALLSIPWVIVTGSLSYNECAMLALFAGAILVAADGAISAIARAATTAFLVGVACGCKPTALLFCAAPVGLIMLRNVPIRTIPKLALVALPVGTITLSPWLVRNYLASGNPVFPQLSKYFGTGHWDVEQIGRYAVAHSFTGSIGDRIGLLFSSDRGIFHSQFGLAFLALILLGALLFTKLNRTLAVLLLLGIASQLGAWLFATHLQSRFLRPLLVPFAIAAGVFCCSFKAKRVAEIAIGTFVVFQGFWFSTVYLHQRSTPQQSMGDPNFLLFAGPGYFTGELFRDELQRMSGSERDRIVNTQFGPEAFIRFAKISPRSLLLVGDATPLYFGLAEYSTTWDISSLLERDVSTGTYRYRTSAELKALGITHMLINFGELDRYCKSKWNQPLLTPEAVGQWLKVNSIAIKQWPDRATLLVELQAQGAAPRNSL